MNQSTRGKYNRPGKIILSITFGFPVAVVSLWLLSEFGFTSLGFGLFVVSYALLSAAFLKEYHRKGDFDLLGPAVIMVVLIYMYASASALYVEASGGRTDMGYVVTPQVRFLFFLSCMIGLAGLATGMLWIKRRGTPLTQRRISNNRLESDNRQTIVKAVFITILFASFFFEYYRNEFDPTAARSYAERALITRIERAASLSGGVEQFMFVEIPAKLILICCVLILFNKVNVGFKVGSLIVFLLYIFTQILNGWRGQVISALFLPLLFFHYRVRKIGLVGGLVGGLLLFFFMSGLSLARMYSDPAEMYQSIENNIIRNEANYFKFSSSGELIVGTNLMRLIGGLETGETDYNFGKSVFTDILVFIPRPLFPTRPLPLSEKFVSIFYPEVYRSGGGLGLFILQEGYWAFGFVGVFVFMLFHGAVVEIAYQWFRRNTSSDFAVLLYTGIYYAIVMTAVRSGTIGSFKTALMNSVPTLLIMLVPILAFKRRRVIGRAATNSSVK